MNAAPESSVDFGAEDNARLAAVCGPLDENLHQIENRLGIEIRRRSGRFSLRGANAAAGAAVLRQLYERAGSQPVSPEDVHLAIQESGMGARPADDAHAVETLRGLIRGRGANQQQYLQAIRSHDLTFGIGPAGTGKTYLAVACAVEAMQRESVRRLVLVRPAVEAGERLGFLPGDLSQKVDPYLRPMYDALYEMIGFDRVARLIERNVIEVAPLAFMRGRTLNEAFIILDEAQNTTVEQIKMFLTRIGFGSRAVVTGDITQTDLPAHRQSGLRHALEVLDGVKGIAVTRFTAKDVVRHPLVQRIVEAYERESGEDNGVMSARRRAALPHAPALGAGPATLRRWARLAAGRSQGRARHPRRGQREGRAAERALARPRVRDQRAVVPGGAGARRPADRRHRRLRAGRRARGARAGQGPCRALGAHDRARHAAPARLRPPARGGREAHGRPRARAARAHRHRGPVRRLRWRRKARVAAGCGG